MKITKLTSTTVAPVGVAMKKEIINPIINAKTEMTAERIVAPLKVLARDMAERVGKIIKLEIRSEPSKRIPSTTTVEQITAKIMS